MVGRVSMASLQDQLLKAGLIDSKKAKQVTKEKRRDNKVARRSNEPVVDEVKLQAELSRAEKAERDRELNRQRDLELQQKAVAAQIKQLIENHRQPKGAGKGEVEYHFSHTRIIKKIFVSPAVQQQIMRGQLVIVAAGEGYELVPRVVAEKIAQRDEKAVITVDTKASVQEDEDDPYKDYVIP